jgi:7,8-dihydropterin-6-yl-methyl-4-(beta-D-ribofuranosyl)aminobenzene 5'-phosphate synthase
MALITVTTLEGKERKILMDSGWNNDWVDYIYEMNNIPAMLKSGEIEFMILSHWHLDHYWGIESTLKAQTGHHHVCAQDPLPGGYGAAQGRSSDGKKQRRPGNVHICKNDVPHTGKLILCDPDGEKDGIYNDAGSRH